MRPSRGLVAAGVLVTVVASVTGCSSQGDRQFRTAVVPVLQRAAKLESLIGVEAPKFAWGSDNIGASRRIDSDAARAIGEVRDFESTVTRLPSPTSKRLRLLRSSLEQLGTAAEAFVQSEAMSRRSMVPYGIPSTTVIGQLDIVRWSGRGEGVSAAQFADALLAVAAVEKVVLGSTTVRKEGKWFDPVGPHPEARQFVSEWPDSLLAVRESQVSAQISGLN